MNVNMVGFHICGVEPAKPVDILTFVFRLVKVLDKTTPIAPSSNVLVTKYKGSAIFNRIVSNQFGRPNWSINYPQPFIVSSFLNKLCVYMRRGFPLSVKSSKQRCKVGNDSLCNNDDTATCHELFDTL